MQSVSASKKVSNIVKLSRPRTWFFIITTYFLGICIGGTDSVARAGLGLAIFIIWVGATNVLNSYTDKDEDRENLPARYEMVRQTGDRPLLWYCIAAFGGTLVLSALINVQFFIAYAGAVLVAVFYSAKPLRLKSRPGLDLLTFSGAVFFPLMGGWLLTGEELSGLPVLFIFLAYWFMTYGTFKNIPDYEGDKRTGVRNFATVFPSRKAAVKAGFLLVLTSFVLLGLLVGSGLLPGSLMVNMGWLPLVAMINLDQFEGDSFKKLERAHTLGFFYAFGFLAITLILISGADWWCVAFIASSIALLALIHLRKVDSR